MLNPDTSDRYVYVGDKAITYTNKNGDKLRLENNDVFWYIVIGHREIISAHKYGEGPIFRLTEEQIQRLSDRAEPQPSPEFTKRRQREHKKFLQANSKQLALNMRNAFKKVLEHRHDDSASHLVTNYADGKIIVAANVDLGGSPKHSRIVRAELIFNEKWDIFQFRIELSDKTVDKQVLARTAFVKDMLKVVESLKLFWKKKYGIQSEAAYYGSALMSINSRLMSVMYWNSKFVLP